MKVAGGSRTCALPGGTAEKFCFTTKAISLSCYCNCYFMLFLVTETGRMRELKQQFSKFSLGNVFCFVSFKLRCELLSVYLYFF